MPGDFGFEGMMPEQGNGMVDPQMRNILAQIMQARQGTPPQMPGGAMSDQDMRALQPQVPEGTLSAPSPPGAGQPPFPASPDPRYTPEVEKRMQQFTAEPPGARRQPRTPDEDAALQQLLQQEQRRMQSEGGQFALPGR